MATTELPDPTDDEVAVTPEPEGESEGEGMKPLPFDESNQPKRDR